MKRISDKVKTSILVGATITAFSLPFIGAAVDKSYNENIRHNDQDMVINRRLGTILYTNPNGLFPFKSQRLVDENSDGEADYFQNPVLISSGGTVLLIYPVKREATGEEKKLFRDVIDFGGRK